MEATRELKHRFADRSLVVLLTLLACRSRVFRLWWVSKLGVRVQSFNTLEPGRCTVGKNLDFC